MANPATALGITLMLSMLYVLHAACTLPFMGASSAHDEAPALHAFTANTATSIHAVEAQALLDFRKGIISDPYGRLASWTIRVSNESSSAAAAAKYGPCSAAWSGIVCDAQKQHVIGLNLGSSNLSGSISLSLALLPALSSLNLSNNFLHGSLPSGLFNLPQSALRHLDLSSNLLDGSLPDSFANLSGLLTLDLSRNNFVGEIPPSLGQCKALQELHLIDTGVSGIWIPSQIWQLPDLIKLEIGGLLEASLGQKLASCPTIQVLELHYVNATGSAFPAYLSECKQLRALILKVFGLEGFIPAEFWQLPLLEILVVEVDNGGSNYTTLHGSLASSFRFCPTITELSVDGVNLTGEIPPFLGQCTALQSLVLADGSLEGEIPKTLGNLSNLAYLDLSGNKLEGEIPKTLGNLSNLVELDLLGNKLEGEIPSSLGNCSALQVLLLANNKLSGEIPLEVIAGLIQLDLLDLSNNTLTGRIEAFDLFNTRIFAVQQNNFIGGLPTNLTSSKSLVYFDVQRNRLSGALPFAHMMGRAEDDVSGMGLMELRVLSMSFNQFTGEIPWWVWKLPRLQVLDLSNNHFDGIIPMTVTHLLYFKHDQSQQNLKDQQRLYEKVPIVIKGNFQVLSYIDNTRISLDISNNSLEGEITESFGELLGLTSLILSHNRIGGRIPASLGKLVNLDDLNLSHNKLTGSIPEELGQLGGAVVDLSFNHLQGPIPTANNFNTRYNRSIFEGNLGLCGAPLSVSCSDGKAPILADDGVKKHECRRVCAALHWIESFASPWALLASFPIGLLGGFYISYRVGIIP